MATDDALKKAKDLLKKQKKTLDKGEKKHGKLVEAKNERDSSKVRREEMTIAQNSTSPRE